jgi:maltooligosyltrehalose trehalohydrolase
MKKLGAILGNEQGTTFRVFSTTAKKVAVRLDSGATHPMKEGEPNVFEAHVADAGAGTLYKFVLDEDRELPDPYARFLPQGVHSFARVEARAGNYEWKHPPVERPLAEHVIYELHVGTFTPEGTFAAARSKLSYLADLGITAIELLPLNAFAGERGWGYDGVSLYAPHAAYGEPNDLRAFVDDAHALGLAVFLDVVYNHFGPAGNYLSAYAPEYFTSEVKNLWGDAPNYAHPAMRRLVIDNARYWLEEFRFDGLRLDAVHAIVDTARPTVLEDLRKEIDQLKPPRRLLFAEDDRNQPALVRSGGPFDAIWTDDFHHQVRTTLTGEKDGYFKAYPASVAEVAKAIERGWIYEGQTYEPWGSARGNPSGDLPAESFVFCIQNHDQVGNRALGERLTKHVSLDAYCALSTLLLFLPMTPLLFMGQEWAASTPFLFFTDHEADLGEKVREGRRSEFKTFDAFRDPAMRERIPDPQSRKTFEASKLVWEEREQRPHDRVLRLYKSLLHLRHTDRVLRADPKTARTRMSANADGRLLIVQRWLPSREEERVLMVNLSAEPHALPDFLDRATVMLSSSSDANASALLPWTATIFGLKKSL